MRCFALNVLTLGCFQLALHHPSIAQQWSSDGPDYLPLGPTKYSNVRHLLNSYWPNDRHDERVSDHTLADADAGESHLSHKVEHLYPVPVHTSKPWHRSLFSDPSLLLTATVPPLLLTVLTFPLTLTLLFHIVRQLVVIQNTFNQSMAVQGATNPRTLGRNASNAENNLERALDKFTSK